jgi:phosphate transport system ATP-binding protein
LVGAILAVSDLTLHYGGQAALNGISFEVPRSTIFSIIGPAQSGKSSLLRILNRTIDYNADARVSGSVLLDGEQVLTTPHVHDLRRKVGMVAPLPVGLPLSIYDNVAFAPRLAGMKNKADLDGIVESCLLQAALWDEVKDRLNQLGTRLSGGQQQRLTIARALSHTPDLLCLDEFSIAIDPVTTMRIEEVLRELKSKLTIILVTNLIQQARRLSDHTLFLWNGSIIEQGTTEQMFSGRPANSLTYDYIRGAFG